MQKERWETLLESVNHKMDLFIVEINVFKKKSEDERIERSIKRKSTLLSLGQKERLPFLTKLREIRMESAKQHWEWRKHWDEKFNEITRRRDERLKDLRDSVFTEVQF